MKLKHVAYGVCFPVIAVVLYPVLFPIRTETEVSPSNACLSNLKQTTLSTVMYMADWDERLPTAAIWADLTMLYSKNRSLYTCVAHGSTNTGTGHAYRQALQWKDQGKFDYPGHEVMQFDASDMRWNAHGGLELLPAKGRHKDDRHAVGFVDGHAKTMDRLSLVRFATSRP